MAVTGTSLSRMLSMKSAAMILFAFASSQFDAILIHASVIKYNGKGFLFLGKSGTGKSTHSALWLKYIPGSTLLNDDNPVVRISDDGTPIVYGSPWSGKTPCYKNESAPVGGFLRLWQAPANEITQLSSLKAYAALYPTVSSMKWENHIANRISDTLTMLIRKLPVFSLKCLPNEEAARMSFKALTSENKVHVVPNHLLLSEVQNFVDEGRSVIIKVKGNSMLPFIYGGIDSIELIKQKEYNIGDVVLAEISDGRYVVHRLIDKWTEGSKNYARTMGDGCLRTDNHFSAARIVAKAIKVIRDGKEIDLTSRGARFKAACWLRLRPIRRVLLPLMRRTCLKSKLD